MGDSLYIMCDGGKSGVTYFVLLCYHRVRIGSRSEIIDFIVRRRNNAADTRYVVIFEIF
jgi:hypothetical protein